MTSRLLVPLARNSKRGMALWGGSLPSLPRVWQSRAPAPRTWDTLSMVDHSLRDMDRQFNQMFRDINSLFRDFRFPAIVPEDTAGIAESGTVIEDGQPKFKMNMYLGERFTPENVKVSMKDRLVTIEAKVDETSQDGTSRVYQEIVRKFTLPEKVDLKEVKSIMGPDGVLKIEAKLPPGALPEEPKPKEIPIQIEQ